MITADSDKGVLQLAACFEFLNDESYRFIPGFDLAEVVGEVLPDFMNIGKKGGHLAFKLVRVDSPKRFAAPLRPLSMNIGGAEPIAERLPLPLI